MELLVALVFTGILMAGMSSVFKSSLSSFVTSGEGISSARRNRLAMDLLSDDLNSAGQYLALEAPPRGIMDANPGFLINPKVPFPGTDIPVADAVTDELLFYYDEPLPFEGTFKSDTLGTASYVASGAAAPVGGGVDLKFLGSDQAAQVKAGMMLITRGNYEHKKVISASPGTDGKTTTVTLDGLFGEKHLATEGVLIAKPAQYVRYRIFSQNWDPQKPTGIGIPCLVREQGNYPGSGPFVPDATLTTIVAENVSRFTVSLSADRGTTWTTGNSWAEIKASLNSQLTTAGAPGFNAVENSPHWFRSVPLLVRVNVTTRTAQARAEFSATSTALAYKEQTQSLILLPRHFGLNF
ncbi:hypothetical protein [Geothrix sp. PMB-07]|uniref:hypothetical protein n=1 Tax=Geothrix sp. PMB-07 TaxID=3068640 RepID=UPI00274068AE|nr:hypothetical protein [Geothrix sp. PMB-07]WLT33562.1 hypothetical protein Q9293_06135 [Geothrix sp. PMB-07]